MADGGIAARRETITLLGRILGEGASLREALAESDFSRLSPADRARTQRLTQDVLRGLERADSVLGPYLRKPPPLRVMNTLRLGTLELANGEAAYGVVSALVQITGHYGRGAFKGLVNATLRRVSRNTPVVWKTLPTPRLPDWPRAALVEAWGAKAVTGIEAAHFAGAPLDITPGPGTHPTLPDAITLPTGSLRLRTFGQVTSLPGFAEGQWWVQDAAAALPARLLGAQPGEAVLDMCAAPGGKTLQLAASGAEVTALDISEARIARLRGNLKRCGLSARVTVCDALAYQGLHDAVLLDAPCSATGTIRRHPDLPYVRDRKRNARSLAELQTRMLAHAWRLVRPGGRLVFCTCSLLREEGELQTARALVEFPDMSVDRAAAHALRGVPPGWITDIGELRLRPDYWPEWGGIDGFYMVRLKKAAP